MSAFGSDPALDDVRDVEDGQTEVDVATNLLTGTVRLSILWTQEIMLSPDDAEEVARALQRAGARAEHSGGSGRAVDVLRGGRERLGALLRRRRVHPHDLPAVAVEVKEAA